MKVTLYADCGFVGCQSEVTLEVDDDISDEELSTMAEEFMYDVISPEYWFVKEGEE